MAGREYSIVRATFWTGDTGRKLRDSGKDAQLVAAYLITCSSANMIGLYYLPLPLLCHELKMSIEGASKALQLIEEAGFAQYDVAQEVVYVAQMARQQLGAQMSVKDNRHKKVVQLWHEMRKSRFYADFYSEYKRDFSLPTPKKHKPLQSPLEGAYCAGGRFGEELEQDQEQEQDQDTLPPQAASAHVQTKEPYSAAFEAFWAAYPMRVGKGRANKAWLLAVKGMGLRPDVAGRQNAIALILEAATLFAASPVGKGRYCPHPATWLSQSRFEDDPAEWNRTDERNRNRDTVASYQPNPGQKYVSEPG